jgi:hypothetical protein
VRALAAERGVRVAEGEAGLHQAFADLLGDPDARAALARGGAAAVAGERGAARRAVARLAGWGLWPPS